MSIYYLKSTGSATAPFDTEEKAANSMWSIRAEAGFAVTDTIILCDDVEETAFIGDNASKLCNIESKEGLETRPVYYYNIGSSGPLYTGTETFSISDIEIKYNNTAPMWNTLGADITSTNCIYTMENHNLHLGTYIDCLIVIGSSSGNQGSILSEGVLDQCTIIDNRASHDGVLISFATESGNSITNCIFYDYSETRLPTLVETENIMGIANIHNNVYYVTSAVDFIYNRELLSSSNGVDNLEADPLFEETTTYTLSSSSPAIGHGTGGTDAGWVAYVAAVIALVARTIAQVLSDPAKSSPKSLTKDTDNGGGIKHGNSNDIEAQIITRRAPKRPAPNGYKAVRFDTRHPSADSREFCF